MTALPLTVGPTPDDLMLLRELVRDAVSTRTQSAPDEQWARSWTNDWGVLDELGLWSTYEAPDGSWAAAAVVAEEAARALYPGPVCEALSGAYLLDQLVDGEALRAIADGMPAAVLVSAAAPCVRPEPETLLLIVTRGGDVVAAPAAEAQWMAPNPLDVTRRVARMRVDTKSANRMGDADDAPARIAQWAKALLYCADSLGCIEHVIQRAVEYARQRTTFGAPIGKYQAVAHRLVDHAVTAKQIRLLLDLALRALDEGADDVTLQVATVETLCHGRSVEIISDCIQLAGAIGFTWEFGHHFYLRRVAQNGALAGGRGRPAQRLAKAASW